MEKPACNNLNLKSFTSPDSTSNKDKRSFNLDTDDFPDTEAVKYACCHE